MHLSLNYSRLPNFLAPTSVFSQLPTIADEVEDLDGFFFLFVFFSRPCTTKRAIFWVTVKSFGKSVREGRPRLCVADGKARVKVKALPFRTNRGQSPAKGDHSALGTKTTDRLREIKELLLDPFVLTQVRIMGWKMCLSGSELEVGLKVISALQNWEKPKDNIKNEYNSRRKIWIWIQIIQLKA